MAAGLTTGDWVQIGGLAVNAGLLAGVIVELRFAARARRHDLASETQRATLDAWRSLSESIRVVEGTTQTHFGRSLISFKRAVEFDQLVNRSSRNRRAVSTPATADDSAIIEASEAMRSLLNAADDFSVGVQLGAYDRTIAEQVGGWRLARLLRRYFGYVEVVRTAVDSEEAWGALDRFVGRFLDAQGASEQPTWDLFSSRMTPAARLEVLQSMTRNDGYS